MKTDFIARIPVKVPSLIYPYLEESNGIYYVCNKVGTSVRIYSYYDNYSDALDKAAELSIVYHRNYFVVQVESKIRLL